MPLVYLQVPKGCSEACTGFKRRPAHVSEIQDPGFIGTRDPKDVGLKVEARAELIRDEAEDLIAASELQIPGNLRLDFTFGERLECISRWTRAARKCEYLAVMRDEESPGVPDCNGVWVEVTPPGIAPGEGFVVEGSCRVPSRPDDIGTVLPPDVGVSTQASSSTSISTFLDQVDNACTVSDIRSP